ncbi:MAG: hypothetical protein QOE46_1195 [Acidobacteriota bacterium]|jgi:hypothetical protein|nr:hypothetical protein [Acidobacteriota bacterium]
MVVAHWVDKRPPEIKKKCYKRGLKKMLELKSFRFDALYFVSMTYTSLFGMIREPRKVKHGHLHDWHHAICASAVSVFVTNESKARPGHLGHTVEEAERQLAEFEATWAGRLPCDRALVAAALGAGGADVRVSRGNQARGVYDQHDRVFEYDVAEGVEEPFTVPIGRGGLQASLPCLAQHLKAMDNADPELERGVESVRDPLRRTPADGRRRR